MIFIEIKPAISFVDKRIISALGSFVNESNILTRQVEHFEVMRRSMSEEAKTFYGDYFARYSQYFTSVGQDTSLRKLQDSGVYETFEGALLDKYPSPVYKYVYYSMINFEQLKNECEFNNLTI